MKKIVVFVLFFMLIPCISFAQFSTNPNDLIPIAGTTWKFQYALSHYEFTTTINFDNNILSDSNNAILVYSVDEKEWLGVTMYGDFIDDSGKRGFICGLFDPPPTNENKMYIFQINNNSANGIFYYHNILYPEVFQTSPLIGIKIGDYDPNQPISSDPNQPIITLSLTDPNQPTLSDPNQTTIIDPGKSSNNNDSNSFGCFINSIARFFANCRIAPRHRLIKVLSER